MDQARIVREEDEHGVVSGEGANLAAERRAIDRLGDDRRRARRRDEDKDQAGSPDVDREVGEECDDGDPENPKDTGESGRCNNNCKLSRCGDGITNISAGEQCDDSGESKHCNADCSISACGLGTRGRRRAAAGSRMELRRAADLLTCGSIIAPRRGRSTRIYPHLRSSLQPGSLRAASSSETASSLKA